MGTDSRRRHGGGRHYRSRPARARGPGVRRGARGRACREGGRAVRGGRVGHLAGEVTAGNPKLKEKPETLNTDPYGEGWLMRLKPAPGALTGAALLSAADYQKVLEAEGG